MPSTPRSIISSKKARTLFGFGAIEQSCIGGQAEAALDGLFDAFGCLVVGAFAADGEVVMLALAVHVNDEREIFAGLELVDLFFEQQAIGAEVNVLFARDQALNDLTDLGMHERFAARDADQGRSALIGGFEALLRSQVGLQDVGRILDLAAARAGEVAAEQGLQHEDDGELLPPAKFLADDVAGHSPHL